jgi:hypothetical protein
MINYQLPNGKTVRLSVDAFLRMSDDEFKNLNDSDLGPCSENPYDLSLDDTSKLNEDIVDDLD